MNHKRKNNINRASKKGSDNWSAPRTTQLDSKEKNSLKKLNSKKRAK